MTKYPEHEKLTRIKEKSQAVGEFLEWLEHDRGLVLAEYPRKHQRGCNGECLDIDDECPEEHQDRLCTTFVTTERLLAEFFEIDLKVLEEEKEAMVAELRAAQETRP